GVWTLFVKGLGELAPYKYQITTKEDQVLLKADPFAFLREVRMGTSLTYNLDGYEWSKEDAEWLARRGTEAMHEEGGLVISRCQLQPLLIYEVHLGSWKRHDDGSYYTYEEFAQELVPYVASMGYTHIQLMPVMEHLNDESLGYQVSGFYSVSNRFGTPRDFMGFVDACHQAGLAVILDWTPGGFCCDEFGLCRFNGQKLFEAERQDDPGDKLVPGQSLRFDFALGPVWSYLISNAIFYFEVFHIDGLRMDVTRILYKDGVVSCLKFDTNLEPEAHKSEEALMSEDVYKSEGDPEPEADFESEKGVEPGMGIDAEMKRGLNADSILSASAVIDAVTGLEAEPGGKAETVLDSAKVLDTDTVLTTEADSGSKEGSDGSGGVSPLAGRGRGRLVEMREIDSAGVSFVRALSSAIRKRYPGALLFTEETSGWQGVTQSLEENGLGFDFKCDHGWSNDVLRYAGTDFSWRPSQHRLVSFSSMYLFSESVVLPLSHRFFHSGSPSLIERQAGDYGQKFAGLRALYCYFLAHPGKKLAFMGTELAQFTEWNYRVGLEWFLLDYDWHEKLQSFVREANEFYVSQPALWALDMTWDGFVWVDADNAKQGVFCFARKARRHDDQLVVVLNMSTTFYDRFRIGVPVVYEEPCWKVAESRSRQRFFEEVFNSDAVSFGGSGKLNEQPLYVDHIACNHCTESLVLCLPPLSGVFLRPRLN
ncbi:MAG: alpha amylase C-terminal domain-containing protein, partial [Gracilibacteraceae bacterium]|nr:alpha amylase C-terminal domain-containing protein [Gracilibacteraceae bacterium]